MVQRDNVHSFKAAESGVEGDDSASSRNAHHNQAGIGPRDSEDVGSLQIARAHVDGIHTLGNDHRQSFDIGLVPTEETCQQADGESTHYV